MKLSIIIPAYNEEKTIGKVLERVNRANIKNLTKQVIVVNDGSGDNTGKIIEKEIRKIKNSLYIQQKNNQGKGAAIVKALKYAKGEYILIQDADLEYNPRDMEKLLKPIYENRSQVVYGTRLRRLPNFKRDEKTPIFFIHYLGNKVLSFITSLLYGQWITDMETCYKIFPKKALKGIKINARKFEFEPEITAKLLKAGYFVYEIPISTNPRGYKEGKKVNALRDGIMALYTLIKYRFTD